MINSIVSFIVFIIISSGLLAQNLDSNQFHLHRNNLNSSFSKFENQKNGRVVFLGGSITFNPGWRDSICNFLQNEFQDTKFDFINAGVPSMGSTPGAFRFEKDVLANGKVDLLFVEAAVNDDTNKRTSEEIIRGMEGIVRHAKRVNPDCDLVMMFFVDPGKMEDYRKGNVPEVIELHEKVAQHYNISTINLAKEVTNRIDKGEFNWEDDFKDLHPSPFGQNIYSQSIKSFLEDELNSDSESSIFKMPEPLDNFSYSNGMMLEVNPPNSIKGWTFD